MEHHAAELRLTLPSSWREDISRDSSGKGLQEVIASLAGQMVARYPQLLPYFEAGYNVPLGASHRGPEGVTTAVARLSLPKELSEPRQDALSWVNEIHSYFEDALRQSTD